MENIKQISCEVRNRVLQYSKAKNKMYFDDLIGFCAISSAILFKELKKTTDSVLILANHDHVFIKCEQYIVDITITQFDSSKEKVFIKHFTDYYLQENVPYYHKIEKKFDNFISFIKFMKYWPNDQIPHDHVIKEILHN